MCCPGEVLRRHFFLQGISAGIRAPEEITGKRESVLELPESPSDPHKHGPVVPASHQRLVGDQLVCWPVL